MRSFYEIPYNFSALAVLIVNPMIEYTFLTHALVFLFCSCIDTFAERQSQNLHLTMSVGGFWLRPT